MQRKEDSPSVSAWCKTAVRFVSVGRVGWTRRLAKVSLDMEPHLGEGRRLVFRRLTDDLTQDLYEFAERREWPSSWVVYCENKLEQLYTLYTTKNRTQNTESDQKDTTDEDFPSPPHSPSSLEELPNDIVAINNFKWVTSVSIVFLAYCFFNYCTSD